MKTTIKRRSASVWALALLLVAGGIWGVGCGPPEDEPMGPQVQVIFNSPGWISGTERNRMPAEFISERIDAARVSVDAAVYGFNQRDIVDALVRAHYRGVPVRLVADAGEYGRGSFGYEVMEEHRVQIQTGNQFHIMHNKFFIIDDRFVFTGTGNISRSEFTFNNNNWLWLDHPGIAAAFSAEFEQMFEGARFSAAKEPLGVPNTFQVGDTEVEVWFSPQDDAMGRILEELRQVNTSIHFTIFAFTKDQVATEFINRNEEFVAYNQTRGFDELSLSERALAALHGDPDDLPRGVYGILDRSQLHGNGQYHQGYRLAANAVPMRLDGNYNSRIPGDYQAGGGRLHAKTMILDAGTPDARVITGSFNWSSAATISNDEVLLILRGERITEEYMREFEGLWRTAKDLSASMCLLMYESERLTCDVEMGDGSTVVQPGDVVISEVHFDGWNGNRDPSHHTCSTGAASADGFDCRRRITNDQFVELYNTTDRPINLSLWTLHNGHDIIMGFTPGTVIHPGQHFLVLDHNTIPLSERDPQRGDHAFLNPDFVLNTANDPRFRRLNLKSGYMDLSLRNSKAEVIDQVGDGGPAFYGGRDGDMNYSMERIIPASGPVPDGTLRSSWRRASGDTGGANVHPDYRDFIIATPGESNRAN